MYCIKCGAKLEGNPKFCCHCGQPLVQVSTPEAQPPPAVPPPVATTEEIALVSNEQSSGSKLGAIAGVVIVVAFFLPWLRACGAELSGYDIATNELFEDAWMYWATPLVGLFCIVLFFLLKTDNARTRIQAAVARLVAGLVGSAPILYDWYDLKLEGLEILYGGWITVLGYLGILGSFFVDLGGSTEKSE